MRARDTSPAAHRRQLAAYRRMSGAQRLERAWDLSEQARTLAARGIRSRHPEYGGDEVQRALCRLLLGSALAREAWPDDALPEP